MNNLTHDLSQSLTTSFIDYRSESFEDYRPKLLVNNYKRGTKVLSYLTNELEICNEFYFSIAFITISGLNVLLSTLEKLEKDGIKGKIITTNYLNFNEPRALEKLLEFTNLEVKVYDVGNFHTKGYIFKKLDKHTNKEIYSLIVGSSNLTQEALTKNQEWNLKVTSLEHGELLRETFIEFNNIWEKSKSLTKEWIDEYAKSYKIVNYNIKEYSTIVDKERITPNSMQKEALLGLDELRKNNQSKGLLISATGTGKTYLSAFDVNNVKPRKMLFLVHREQILKQAEETFQNVLGHDIETGFLSGNSKDYDAKYLFSTVQMLSKDNVREKFGVDEFDFIIIDETHKAESISYKKIINYFKPKFLLGMTATPERTDGGDIYEIFDHNIAYEIRLQRAMEEDMLCPFHYFGVSELKIDGIEVDEKVDFKYLTSKTRVDNIIEKIDYYSYSGDRVKGLIFCSKTEEAKDLSEIFNQRGYQTIALCGEDNQEKRESAVEKLEQNNRDGGLDYIFTVDIFNEGIDIPCINQVVMLRPTKSSIIFIQQLGRGLRKYQDKEFVVVIDFIGNYENNFLIPIALSGDRSYNKDTVRRYVAEGNRIIPGCSTINFDKISKEKIYAAIDKANFSEVKIIKEEYFDLKNKLGRIPEIEDFEKFGEMEIIKFIDKFGSYYAFLKKYEKKEYLVNLSIIEEEIITYISQKFVKSKRIHELELINCLFKYSENVKSIYKESLKDSYNIILSDLEENSLINNSTNNFGKAEEQKKFSNCVLLNIVDNDYRLNKEFNELLKKSEFKEMIQELINYGIRRYKEIYMDRYKDTNFVLYQKYTYEDVCRLLNWDKNMNAQNIGGYFFDKKTHTMPVFINYVKDEGSIGYEDRFLSISKLIALSKHPRKISSKDAEHIYQANEEGTKIYLFVRKSKDDKDSKEFYFLGEINAVGEPNPIKMELTKDDAFEITYHLETSVREDIYDYLTT